jgi:murein DD-endopeptidase MepM/ murein hydrolase activator NlpD
MKPFSRLVRIGIELLLAVTACLILGSVPVTVFADDPPDINVLGRTHTMRGPRPVVAGGGGQVPGVPHDHMTPRQSWEIEGAVRKNVERLKRQGKLLPESTHQVSFIFPVTAAPSFTDPGYYGISNYIDHNAAYQGQIRDYMGGTRSYDTTDGYNHQGTDIYTWPFPWNKMDNNQVYVIAAADGTIVEKQDGQYDRVCQFLANAAANYLIIRHSDGSYGWYFHMKKNSLPAKNVGDTVAQGEVLGVVGSSGSSSNPHLHFEIRGSGNTSNDVIDPWAGPSNPTTTTSWWESQNPYYDWSVNRLSVGMVPPVNPACTSETPNDSGVARQNPNIFYTTVYFRDQQANQTVTYKILRPNGTTWTTWTHSSGQYYSSSWWYWGWIMGTGEPTGTWKLRVEFTPPTSSEGTHAETYEKTFTVLSPTSATLTNFSADLNANKKFVKVKWETGSELNVLGFYVWRRVGEGEWKKVNAEQIAAKNAGSIGGARYTFTDEKVKTSKKYFYKLEIVRADGTSEWSQVAQVKTK